MIFENKTTGVPCAYGAAVFCTLQGEWKITFCFYIHHIYSTWTILPVSRRVSGLLKWKSDRREVFLEQSSHPKVCSTTRKNSKYAVSITQPRTKCQHKHLAKGLKLYWKIKKIINNALYNKLFKIAAFDYKLSTYSYSSLQWHIYKTMCQWHNSLSKLQFVKVNKLYVKVKSLTRSLG